MLVEQREEQIEQLLGQLDADAENVVALSFADAGVSDESLRDGGQSGLSWNRFGRDVPFATAIESGRGRFTSGRERAAAEYIAVEPG